MKFSRVAYYFELIEKETARTRITQLLAELFTESTAQQAHIIANFSLGLLRPPYQGTQFNLAGKSLIKIIADLIDKDPAVVNAFVQKDGDIGAVARCHLSHEPQRPLTVQEVFEQLEELERISGQGSQEEKAYFLKKLFKTLDPLSVQYVLRIILGTLRLGFSDMTIIDALSWMEVGNKSLRARIEHAYNICVDIGLVAYTMKKEGITGIDAMNIHPGIPIRPAAAERLPTAQAVFEKVGQCIAQPKLDGFRIQIHIYHDEKGKQHINFFSRNLTDMSAMFPDIVQRLIVLDVDSVIFEGEAIAYDTHTGSFLPFQETVKRKRKHDIEQVLQDYPLRVFLFDLLYLDGKSYLNVGHEERREILKKLSKQFTHDDVQVIEEIAINSARELEEYFYQKVDAGLEGIVVKKMNAPYQPGKRNFNWIKFKRQEEGHLEDTLDCVILGYYAGKGKRASFGIGAFLVGVFNKKNDDFETVAKIGTGLTDAEWKELKKRCDERKSDDKPKNIVCVKELYPDVWVYPEIVCMVRADEITQSPLHAAGKHSDQLGYALRFPRFMGYRPDKSAQEATTVQEVVHLYKDQFST